MKASLELADRRRGFQPDAWQVRPTDAFERDAFQETSWQEDPHSGAWQDEAFQDEAYQVTEDAFQENAWQGAGAETLRAFSDRFQVKAFQQDPHRAAFQIELEPPSAVEIERALQVVLQAVNRSSVW